MSGIGRNNPCPCGSGRKYKKCCLSRDDAKRAEVIVEQESQRDRVAEDPARKVWGEEAEDAVGADFCPEDSEADDEDGDSEEATLEEKWWDEFNFEYRDTEDVKHLRDMALQAIREAPTFTGDDGAELVIHFESLVKTVEDGQALMDVIEAWTEHRPETLSEESVWLAPTRVDLALRFGLGDLEDAVQPSGTGGQRNQIRCGPAAISGPPGRCRGGEMAAPA